MDKIRIGKDFNVLWSIYKKENGVRVPYDLEGRNLQLSYNTPFSSKEITDFTVRGNVIEWTFFGKDQIRSAVYTLLLVENKGKEGMVTVDRADAFQLVSRSAQENIDGSSDVVIEVVELDSNVELAPTVVYVGGGDITVDSYLSETSTNAVQNKVVTKALKDKQDVISDLATIRSGAAKGATAIQEHQDISGKQDKLVSGQNIKTINGKSILGSGNIVIEGGSGGSVDLTGYATEDYVDSKVDKKVDKVDGKGLSTNDYTNTDKQKLAGIANGAEVNVQSDWNVTDSSSDAFIKNKPTIPAAVTETTVSGWGFTKNTGTYSKPSGGIPKSDLASAVQTSLNKADTALQTHQDISGKQDKITDLETIRAGASKGATAVQSSDLAAVATSGSYNDLKDKPVIKTERDVVNIDATTISVNLVSNKYYVRASSNFNLQISLAAPADSTIVNEYIIQFTVNLLHTLTMPADIKWANDTAPELTKRKTYVISIINNLAVFAEF